MVEIRHDDMCPMQWWVNDKDKTKWTTEQWYEYNHLCKCRLIKEVRLAESERIILDITARCLEQRHKVTVHMTSNEINHVLCPCCRSAVYLINKTHIEAPVVAKCPCRSCTELQLRAAAQAGYEWASPLAGFAPSTMIVCALCDNKRCPHANHHDNECTWSNEPNQPGSAYMFPENI